MKTLATYLLLIALFTGPTYSQSQHFEVEILYQENFHKLIEDAELSFDHAKTTKNGIQIWVDENDIKTLQLNNIKYKVQNSYNPEDYTKTQENTNRSILPGFNDDGSLSGPNNNSGYYTYNEVLSKLDELSNSYPNIVSSRQSIGLSHENRPIWMVKISDYHSSNNASEPDIYYQSLIHPREPMSMSVLLHYMFWLAENYGNNPIATHLVDNREMYFVPVVNPDGYVHVGNGNFMHRTNRNISSCSHGIDLNRNFSARWGQGATTTTCGPSTYSGPTPFSEKETQKVRDFILSKDIVTAVDIHSYSDIYIEGNSYNNTNKHVYESFGIDMCHENNFGFGTGEEMLYLAGGTACTYYDDLGIVGWTPEVGSNFWEHKDSISPVTLRHLPNMQYVAQIAGEYPEIKSINISNEETLYPGGYYSLDIGIFNKGLSEAANNISIEIVEESENIKIWTNQYISPILYARTDSTFTEILNFQVLPSALNGDYITFKIKITLNGIEYDIDSEKYKIGCYTELFNFDDQNLNEQFNRYSSNTVNWELTDRNTRKGSYAITDSRLYNTARCVTKELTIRDELELQNSQNPYIEFWLSTGFSAENSSNLNYLALEYSLDNGASWTEYKRYINTNPWQKEIMPLLKQNQLIRFSLNTDDTSCSSGWPFQPEGVYIDEIKIRDYDNSIYKIYPGESTQDIYYNPLIYFREHSYFIYVDESELPTTINYTNSFNQDSTIVVSKNPVLITDNIISFNSYPENQLIINSNNCEIVYRANLVFSNLDRIQCNEPYEYSKRLDLLDGHKIDLTNHLTYYNCNNINQVIVFLHDSGVSATNPTITCNTNGEKILYFQLNSYQAGDTINVVIENIDGLRSWCKYQLGDPYIIEDGNCNEDLTLTNDLTISKSFIADNILYNEGNLIDPNNVNFKITTSALLEENVEIQEGSVFTVEALECDCWDNIDNDNDGLTDCEDCDCSGSQSCANLEKCNCYDGYDNDADGLADCLDPDCNEAVYEFECNCSDNIDNDKDGLIDCNDTDSCIAYSTSCYVCDQNTITPICKTYPSFQLNNSSISVSAFDIVNMPCVGNYEVAFSANIFNHTEIYNCSDLGDLQIPIYIFQNDIWIDVCYTIIGIYDSAEEVCN